VKHVPSELRTFRFWRQWSIGVFAAIGFFSVVLGLVLAFFPGFLSHGRGIAIAVIAAASVVYGSIRSWPRAIQRTFDTPNMTIRVVRGDLFEQPGHLMIGMCDTFDTSTPVIIAKESIQGQFLDRIFDGNADDFDRQLAAALSTQEPIGQIIKEGKQAKYKIGTVATLSKDNRCYFCVAYSEMDDHNMAKASIGGILDSLKCLWGEVSAKSNGGVVSIPVIGGGQSKVAQWLPAQDSIRLTILSFVLASRIQRVCSGLDIVLQAHNYDKINRLELQAFLDSLGSS
jgi:hypothetical protein